MADGILTPVADSSVHGQPASYASVDLRPLTTTELIDRSFSLYRTHFTGFLLLALLCHVAPLINQLLVNAFHLNASQELQNEMLTSPKTTFLKLGAVTVLTGITQMIGFCFEMVITFYIAAAYLGKNPSIAESFRKFLTCATSSVQTCLLNLLLIGLTFIFPILAITGPYLYAYTYPLPDMTSLILLGLATFVLFIISMIPVLVVFMRLMVIIPAMAVEGLVGWKAVKRSSALVRYDPGLGFYYWGEMRLSLLLLPLFAIELLIFSLTSLPLSLFELGEVVRHGGVSQLASPPEATVILSQIMTFLGLSLILPLYPIVTTLFYYDIRIRREGYDLEVMAQQLEEAP